MPRFRQQSTLLLVVSFTPPRGADNLSLADQKIIRLVGRVPFSRSTQQSETGKERILAFLFSTKELAANAKSRIALAKQRDDALMALLPDARVVQFDR